MAMKQSACIVYTVYLLIICCLGAGDPSCIFGWDFVAPPSSDVIGSILSNALAPGRKAEKEPRNARHVDLVDIGELKQMARMAAKNIIWQGKPIVSDVYILGSFMYLQESGKVPADTLGDLDIGLIINVNREAVGFNWVLNEFHAHFYDILSQKSNYKKLGFSRVRRNRLDIDLITPSGNVIDTDIAVHNNLPEVVDEWIMPGLREYLEGVIDLEGGIYFSAWTFDGYNELRGFQKYLRIYIQLELLVGDLQLYREYAEKYISAQPDEYQELCAAVEKSGRLAKLRQALNEPEAANRIRRLIETSNQLMDYPGIAAPMESDELFPNPVHQSL